MGGAAEAAAPTGVGGDQVGVGPGGSPARARKKRKKKKRKRPGEHPQIYPPTFFMFGHKTCVRRFSTFLLNWGPYQALLLLAIIANIVVLALEEHMPGNDKTALNIQLEATEPYFLAMFTVESLVAILATGLVLHDESYLRNIWNIMDFVVVITGYLSLIMEGRYDVGFDLRNLRALKTLRPLKLISKSPSLQVILSSILKAMAPLMQIGLLVLFAVVIFAIIGLEFYCGIFHKSCYSLWDLDELVLDGDLPVPCTADTPDIASMGSYVCNANESMCLDKWAGPNSGITSFDNIGFAMLTVFQCTTMEGWTAVLYWTNDALGNAYNWLYFIPLIIIGSFFMLNLALGVLSGEFARERVKVENRQTYFKLRNKQKIEQEMTNFLNWICKAEDMILESKMAPDEEKIRIMNARKKAEVIREEREKIEAKRAAREIGGLCPGLKLFIRQITKTMWFYWLIIILVFLNTACVAVEHYGQPEWLTNFNMYAEIVFLSLFFMEGSMKLYAFGPRIYFNSTFNRFDTVVITGSIFETAYSHYDPGKSFGLSVLRALRLLRIFKVTPYWSPLRNLVISILDSMKTIFSLLFLIFLFSVIFALLGMQLFGGTFHGPEGAPPTHFDSFPIAIITVFQIITGEDWNEVMYQGIEAKGGIKGGGMVFSLYFILLTLFGNYTLLNVFLAIACDNLANAQELTAAEEKEKEEAEEQRRRKEIEAMGGNMDLKEEEPPPPPPPQEEDEVSGPKPILPYSSLFCLSSENFLRKGAHYLVNHRLFDPFITFVIALSSMALASEDPIIEHSEWNNFLGKMDYVFTAVFATEMILKAVDLGVVCHPGAYLRDFWNFLDAVVVLCAVAAPILTFILSGGGENGEEGANPNAIAIVNNIKSLKILRVLRPLKSINRVPKLKAVFDCIIISLKNVVNILIVYMLFHFIFAVVGVQLFNGKFSFCTDKGRMTEIDCQGNFFVFHEGGPPEVVKREWRLHSFHYDNVVMAMLTLFVVQTGELWPNILQNSMATTEIDMGRLQHNRIDMAIFYIVYFIVFPFFFVNVFVALVIQTFQDQGDEALSEGEMDKNQKACIDFAIAAKPLQMYVPKNQNSLKYKVWQLISWPVYENFILFLILLNTFLLMMKFYKQPDEYEYVLGSLNLFFTVVFSIECTLKIYGLGPRVFFRDSWNVFDLITVLGSIIDALATGFGISFINLAFLRLFRAARLVKLLRRGQNIRSLLYTFVQSFKALPYVCLMIALLFFIYAIIGAQLFGNLKNDVAGSSITRNNNFRHLFQSLMLLFRCATGEAWPSIMLDCLKGNPCDPQALVDKDGGRIEDKECGSNAAYIYFVSFVFFCSFLMLNLFVAVIMDNFDYLTRDPCILGAHHLDEFIRLWSDYDRLGIGYIHHSDYFEMLKRIDPPLGFGSKCITSLAYRRLIRMNLPINDLGQVQFTSALFALIRDNLGIKIRPVNEMDQADLELRDFISKVWPNTMAGTSGKNLADVLVPMANRMSEHTLSLGKVYTAKLVLHNWRKTHFRRADGTSRVSVNELVNIMRKKKSLERTNRVLEDGYAYDDRYHPEHMDSFEFGDDEDWGEVMGRNHSNPEVYTRTTYNPSTGMVNPLELLLNGENNGVGDGGVPADFLRVGGGSFDRQRPSSKMTHIGANYLTKYFGRRILPPTPQHASELKLYHGRRVLPPTPDQSPSLKLHSAIRSISPGHLRPSSLPLTNGLSRRILPTRPGGDLLLGSLLSADELGRPLGLSPPLEEPFPPYYDLISPPQTSSLLLAGLSGNNGGNGADPDWV